MSDELLFLTYDIWISGSKLDDSKKEFIDSIDIKETAEGSDVATITIHDPEFLFMEDDIFLENNSIKLRLGWDSSTHRITFDGYISAIDINFADTGIPILTITCMDKTHIMNRKKNNRTFNNTTSAQVVKSIVKSYGFNCVVDSSYPYTIKETITQSNQTDIDFITSLASQEVHPFTARLVGNTFYYEKIGKLTTPIMELSYHVSPYDLISFAAQINKESKQVEISTSSVDTSTKSVSTTSGVVSSGNGSASSGGSGNNDSSYNPDSQQNSSSKSKTYTYDPKTRTWK